MFIFTVTQSYTKQFPFISHIKLSVTKQVFACRLLQPLVGRAAGATVKVDLNSYVFRCCCQGLSLAPTPPSSCHHHSLNSRVTIICLSSWQLGPKLAACVTWLEADWTTT